MKLRAASIVVVFLSSVLSTAAQTPASSAASAQAPPPLIQFSNIAADEHGNTLSGVVSITFSLYSSPQGGEPLWTETQNNVQLDATGHYSVQLGETKPAGVPTALFVTGAARWLGVRIEEQAEQPRVLLLSVPYALKAGDAATIGGLPPSAFVLAASGTVPTDSTSTATSVAEPSVPPSAGTVTGSGTLDFIPLWTSSSNIGNSVLFQSGTGSTAKIGINTTTPGATLDVKGGTNIEGLLDLPATGTATATGGKPSQALNFVASSYNSGTATAVNQTFQWHAEPVGNNTATPSGALSLLFGSGTASPAETGLKLSSKGLFTFATGQTFPGAGTITGIKTAGGSGLTGGGNGGTLNLSLTNTCAANQVLLWNGSLWACSSAGTGTVTSVGSGAGLTGGPITGTGTLSVDTTKVPLLGAANTFTGNQSVTGNISATGTVSVGTVPVVIGNVPSCGSFGGIGFGANSLADCTHYSLIGEGINTYLNRPSRGSMLFREANTTEMVIAPGGNVGIGITTPTFVLHIGTLNNGFRVEGPPAGGSGMVGASFGGYGDFAIDAPFSPAGRFVVKDSTGLVGIGNAAPANELDVHAQSYVYAINAVGFNAPSGSSHNGSPAVVAQGGNDDPTGGTGLLGGGDGVDAFGGADASGTGNGGDGIQAFGASPFGVGGSFVGGPGGDGVDASAGSNGLAAYLDGNVDVTGAISAGTKDFKIDHPLDPANKYLVHASVESSEMMNIYTGNVTTDSQGVATVQVPEWFEALNTDFRYQLTVIGQFAQAIVGHKIENNRFEIRTSAPNVEVSWQVTGVRQDAYAKAHPLVVEEEKESRLRGFYIHPELYGAPEEKQIEWARHPQTMKRMQEMRARQLAAAQKQAAARN